MVPERAVEEKPEMLGTLRMRSLKTADVTWTD
jgi:hypothetical protein